MDILQHFTTDGCGIQASGILSNMAEKNSE